MEIKVNEQTQLFYLACKDKWQPVVGHEIEVGKYKFCAIPTVNVLNVSEITTGMKFYELPMNDFVWWEMETKEKAMKFLEKVGESLRRLIEKTADFDKRIEEGRKANLKQLGEMPEIENVDLKEMAE